MRTIRLALGILAVGIVPQMSFAQTGGSLFGTVIDKWGSPLPGVNIVLQGGGSSLSDGNGKFSIFGITPGNYTVSASLEGYSPGSRSVTIGSANTVTLIELSPAVLNIPNIPIDTSGILGHRIVTTEEPKATAEAPAAEPAAVKPAAVKPAAAKPAAAKPAAAKPPATHPAAPKNPNPAKSKDKRGPG